MPAVASRLPVEPVDLRQLEVPRPSLAASHSDSVKGERHLRDDTTQPAEAEAGEFQELVDGADRNPGRPAL